MKHDKQLQKKLNELNSQLHSIGVLVKSLSTSTYETRPEDLFGLEISLTKISEDIGKTSEQLGEP